MTVPDVTTAPDSLSFEQALARLEEVVARLEQPDTGLDEAMKVYEEGVHLAKNCLERLRAAEQKLTELRLDDAGPTDPR